MHTHTHARTLARALTTHARTQDENGEILIYKNFSLPDDIDSLATFSINAYGQSTHRPLQTAQRSNSRASAMHSRTIAMPGQTSAMPGRASADGSACATQRANPRSARHSRQRAGRGAPPRLQPCVCAHALAAR